MSWYGGEGITCHDFRKVRNSYCAELEDKSQHTDLQFQIFFKNTTASTYLYASDTLRQPLFGMSLTNLVESLSLEIYYIKHPPGIGLPWTCYDTYYIHWFAFPLRYNPFVSSLVRRALFNIYNQSCSGRRSMNDVFRDTSILRGAEGFKEVLRPKTQHFEGIIWSSWAWICSETVETIRGQDGTVSKEFCNYYAVVTQAK